MFYFDPELPKRLVIFYSKPKTRLLQSTSLEEKMLKEKKKKKKHVNNTTRVNQ